jgi:hypothetical protein
MGFAQTQVHTNHSTSACAKPIPEIVPMVKLHSLIVTLIKKMGDKNLSNCILHVYYG